MGIKNTNLLQAAYTSFLIASFLWPLIFTLNSTEKLNPVKISKIAQQVNDIIPTLPQIETIHSEKIIDSLQSKRENIGLSKLIVSSQMCSLDILQEYIEKKTISNESLQSFCPTCTSTAYLGTQANYHFPNQPDWMESEDIAKLVVENYTHLCVLTQDEVAILLLGSPQVENTSINPSQAPLENIKNFSNQQLWQALVDYRHAHTSPDLLYSDNLCIYAQKRVDQHLEDYKNKDISQYLNQDKYPLDAHEGFRVDGESGYVFDVTEFNVVAENLAYWPTAEFPHQVIEWGWDTSTEGHKEAQLSTEYTHSCLVGQDGFYVAIFARN